MNLEDVLSKPHTKAGRIQRACLELIREHEADGALPTSVRFLFYELERVMNSIRNGLGMRETEIAREPS
jgi:hypothetical protein